MIPELIDLGHKAAQAAYYDETTFHLFLKDSRGDVRQYVNVDPDTGHGLFTAPNPASYFREHIKGKYRSVKLPA